MESNTRPVAHNHISVDCVVIGFDGEQLQVLLIKRDTQELHDMKLPGSLIFQDEDLDDAAHRTLDTLAGVQIDHLSQFKTYGSRNRTKNPLDTHWLQQSWHQNIERIVTIAYFSTVRQLPRIPSQFKARWVPLKDIAELAFDHNAILQDALSHMRMLAVTTPNILFNMLPRKFTILQLRTLFSLVQDKELDVRNFHKKLKQMPYVVPTEEFQKSVSHRAARYYRFDRKIYNKVYGVRSMK